MIAQKESITKLRNRMLSAFSGGGSFFLDATLTALAGASLSSLVKPAPLAPATEAIGVCDNADMARLCVLSHLVYGQMSIFLFQVR